MATLHIPPQHAVGLISLRKLNEDSIKELEAALIDAAPLFQAGDLIDHISSKVKSIAATDLTGILEMLISMCAARTQLNVSTPEIAERVCNAMVRSENDLLRIPTTECERFTNRLVNLLSAESLIYPAKAWGVMADHDRIFIRARALTDIRPVFGPDVEVAPKGAVIVHVLNITYQHSGKQDNFYVAMDSEDVESLIGTLQRALLKTRSLQKVFDSAGVTYLNPQ
ncbi:MAG: hypothetical protein WBG50_11750 [Desulfomonilaceae bacterium]